MADYYISFDTREMKNMIKAVKVSISVEYIRDMDKKLPVNLLEDPLYPELEQYVISNFRKKP